MMDDDKIVIKHSGAVQIANTINLFQRKAWNVLLANAYDRLLKQDIFEVSIDELAEVMGFDSHNIKYFKDNIKSLMGCVVEWDMLERSGEWEGYGLLSGAKILNNNTLQYSYHPDLKKKLYNPSTYAKISLSMQKRFSSKYALALYELCVNFFIAKYGKGETPWIDIEDYKKLMDVKKDKHYDEFKNLNRRIINNPVKEINDKSDLYIEVLYRRSGRKVSDIKFRIKPSKKTNNLLEKLQMVSEATRQNDLPLEDNTLAIRQRMEEYGLSEKQIIEIVNDHNEQYITEVLDVVDIKIRADKIDNVAAYTFTAIKEDYRPKKSVKEKLIEGQDKALKELARIAEEQKKLHEKIERDYVEYKKNIVNEYLGTLDETAKSALMESFEGNLSVHEKNMYKDGGLERPAILLLFNQYVSERYLKGRILSKDLFEEKYQLE